MTSPMVRSQTPSPSRSQRPVVSIGECLIDLIAGPETDLSNAGTLTIREGGAPMNVAVGLARLGVPAVMASVVGQDPFGDRLVALMGAEGVDTAHVRQTAEAETTIAYAWKDRRGDGCFRLVRMADRLLAASDVDALGLDADRVEALVFGSVSLSASPSREAVEHAATVAAEAGIPLVFDVNVRPTLWPDLAALRAACEPLMARATVIKLSLDDAEALWGTASMADAMPMLDTFPAPVVVITDGGREVRARRRIAGAPAWSAHPVFAVDAVEPTGAGDAFTAALLSRLIAGGWGAVSDEDIRFGMAAGAIATTKPGAIAALPSAEEIVNFIAAGAG
ncbi:MAG: carbohydrate kinase family protein [Thermomicrobiales bacterium]